MLKAPIQMAPGRLVDTPTIHGIYKLYLKVGHSVGRLSTYLGEQIPRLYGSARLGCE